MTYEGMKSMTSEMHSALAAWVKNGGPLVLRRGPYVIAAGAYSTWGRRKTTGSQPTREP
jgi:hypothetical protein